jgi:hypothetical protein
MPNCVLFDDIVQRFLHGVLAIVNDLRLADHRRRESIANRPTEINTLTAVRETAQPKDV